MKRDVSQLQTLQTFNTKLNKNTSCIRHGIHSKFKENLKREVLKLIYILYRIT